MGEAGRAAAVALATLSVLWLGVAAVPGPAAGGDNVAIVQVEPETARAPPGETIRVAAVLVSDGGPGPGGVERASFALEYDPDVLSVRDVRHGPWMEQGSETEIATATEIDAENGSVWVEQERDPPDGGATGNARFVTVTFAVAEDAAGAQSPVNVSGGEVALTDGWYQQVFPNNGTVTVEQGASVVDASEPESGGPGADGAKNGDATPGTADAQAPADQSDGRDDSIAGFGVGAALVAIVAAVGVAIGRRRGL